MQTSATPICNNSTKLNRSKQSLGFTLIEVLVVVVLIGIIMGTVVGSFTGVNRSQALQGYVERMALRIEIARDRAVQSNREWGIYFDFNEDGLEFAEFDPVSQEWLKLTRRPFKPDVYDEPLQYDVQVEAYDGQTQSNDQDLPKIVLFSSGETTPFKITLRTEQEGVPAWLIHSDGFSRTRFEQVN